MVNDFYSEHRFKYTQENCKESAGALELVPGKIASSYRVTSDDFDEYMSTPKLDPFLQE